MVLLEPLSWDSRHFGFPCARLKVGALDEPHHVARSLSKSPFTFVSSRVGTVETRKAEVLERAGFTVADIRLHLDIGLERFAARRLVSGFEVGSYEPRYQEAIRGISRRSFRTDHFHVDKRFDQRKVDEMYALWVDKCVRERYDIFIATKRGKAAGFLAGKNYRGSFYIELVAVAGELRGRSVGHDLVVHALRAARKSFAKATIGVQLTNVPAIRLYEKLGFRLASSEYTFHWWRQRE